MKELILREVVARIVTYREKIPYRAYELCEPLLDDVRDFGRLIRGLDLDEPETWVTTALSALEAVIDSPTDYEKHPIKNYLNEHKYRTVSRSFNFIAELMVDKKEMSIVVSDATSILCGVKDKSLPFLVTLDAGTNKIVSLHQPIEDAEEAWRLMHDMLWSESDCLLATPGSDNFLDIKPYEMTERQYRGDLLKTMESLGSYMDHGIRRVVVLQGDPGTGKSTLCANAARMLSKRTLVVDNIVLNVVNREQWFEIVQATGPDLVIIDDVDRCRSAALQNALSFFEDTNYEVPITLMTTNDQNSLPNAFRRPGRIDLILEVPTPSLDIRNQIVQEFAEREGLGEVPDRLLPILDKIAQNYPGAYLAEIMRRLKAQGWDYEVEENDIVMRSIWEEATQ